MLRLEQLSDPPFGKYLIKRLKETTCEFAEVGSRTESGAKDITESC